MDRLSRAVEAAAGAGVDPQAIKGAEAHLTAMRFVASRRPPDPRAVLHALQAAVRAIRASRATLSEAIWMGAGPDVLDQALHEAELAGVDEKLLAKGQQRSAARRAAHDTAACALISGASHELQAALKAVEEAGGPIGDTRHLQKALAAALEEEGRRRSFAETATPNDVDRFFEARAPLLPPPPPPPPPPPQRQAAEMPVLLQEARRTPADGDGQWPRVHADMKGRVERARLWLAEGERAHAQAVQIEDEEPTVSCGFGLFGGGSWGKPTAPLPPPPAASQLGPAPQACDCSSNSSTNSNRNTSMFIHIMI